MTPFNLNEKLNGPDKETSIIAKENLNQPLRSPINSKITRGYLKNRIMIKRMERQQWGWGQLPCAEGAKESIGLTKQKGVMAIF